MSYEIVYTRQARKDARKLASGNLKQNAIDLLSVIEEDPFRTPPPFVALVGDLQGVYSRRINIQHRLVYQVYEEEKTVKVLRMWTHYE